MSDFNIEEIIEWGIRRYFDEKDERERRKREEEAIAAAHEAKKMRILTCLRIIVEVIIGGTLMYFVWICYKLFCAFWLS